MDKKYGGYTAAVLREFIEHSKNNGESIDAITGDDATSATVIRDLLDALSAPAEATQAVAAAHGWISVNDQMPKAGKAVLVAFKNSLGNWRTTRAIHAPKFTISTDAWDDPEDGDEDENGDFWVPEGWYEDPVEAECGTMISGVIKHWTPLPPAPDAAPQAPVADAARADQHPDDIAVDAFAAAMKEKLAQARAKGRGGWEQCDPTELSIMLREHVEKGDPRDVANFCMFLWRLGKPISDAALPMGKRAPAQQAVTLTDPEQIAKSFLSQEDSAALFMFHSQAHDSDADGYTERAETMDRLAELGVVQRLPGRGRRFGVTAFGDWLIEAEFAQKPLLPLRTIAEHNSREKAGHALYLKESAPHSTAWVKLARAERESWRRKAALQSHSHSEGERRG